MNTDHFSHKIIAAGAAIVSCAVSAQNITHMPGEVLIQFAPNITDAQIEAAFNRGQLHFLRQIQTPTITRRGQLGLTHVATRLPVEEALVAIRQLPGVAYAQPNWTYSEQAVANDPLYSDGSLWGMYSGDASFPVGPSGTTNPFGSQAEWAWFNETTGSSDVFVGIVEISGFQLDHPDLAQNFWRNNGEVPGNLIDEDNNGYADDIFGWNAYEESGNVFDTSSSHPTHVAGIIGAVGGNGIGVAGVNWNVGLIPVTFGAFGPGSSGTTANAVKAIDYLTHLKEEKGLNIVAINASWSGWPNGAFDQALFGSISRAAELGILFVSSAGNHSSDIDLAPVYPAAFDTVSTAGYDSVLAIASIDSSGLKATNSNYGAVSVDFGAPGVGIYSTIPVSGYGKLSGTSMAAPHTAGALALYASTRPGAAAPQIRADLLAYGLEPTASLSGLTFTGGRLDLNRLLATAPPNDLEPPADPRNLVPTVVSGAQVDLTWEDGSDNELGFSIERSSDSGEDFVLVDTVSANRMNYSDRTAKPGSAYFYRTRAYNAKGSSAFVYASRIVETPEMSLPAAPTSLTANALTIKQGGGIALAWRDNSSNEEGFLIERRTGTTSIWQLIALAPNANYTDYSISRRIKYSYRVRALNAAGASPFSNTVTATAK